MSGYLPNPPAVQEEMLREIGASWESLFKAVPKELRCLDWPETPGKSELSVKEEMGALAARNKVYKSCFLGAGSYRHFIPSVVSALANREEFLSAYTPYQAEISQGILQAIFEYQSLICQLTGLDASNASVYDGATACAEAVNMCREKDRRKMLVAKTLNPWYKETIRTYFQFSDLQIIEIGDDSGVITPETLAAQLDEQTMGLLIQSPNYYGIMEDSRKLAELVHNCGAAFVLCANPLSLALSASARELEADICVGEAQPLGLETAYGGPYLGYMTCREKYQRRLPGRIVGETLDSEGRTAYVLTLQAREQHIRRERATSSICSNQANCALRCAIFLAAVGPQGLREMAEQSYQKAHLLAQLLGQLPDFQLAYQKPFFNEFVMRSRIPSSLISGKLLAHDILPGRELSENEILWCATECNSEAEIERLCALMKELAENEK